MWSTSTAVAVVLHALLFYEYSNVVPNASTELSRASAQKRTERLAGSALGPSSSLANASDEAQAAAAQQHTDVPNSLVNASDEVQAAAVKERTDVPNASSGLSRDSAQKRTELLAGSAAAPSSSMANASDEVRVAAVQEHTDVPNVSAELSRDGARKRTELLAASAAAPSFTLMNASCNVQAQEHEMMTVEGANGWLMLFAVLLLPANLYIAYVSLGRCCARSLGKAIEIAIETFDTVALGVDVEIGRLLVNPFRGVVTVDGLTIKNPKGYTSKYLLNAKAVHIDLDMGSLILSGFRHVVVEKVDLRQVDIIYEKRWSSSNVYEVKAVLDGYHKNKKTKHRIRVDLHSVLLEDVGVRLQGQMSGLGARLALADIKHEHFTKDVGIGYMVQVVLLSVLKTVVANVAGQSTAEWCM